MVSGFDSDINYAKVAKAASYLQVPGCLFVSTNTDSGLPCGNDCVMPGTALLFFRSTSKSRPNNIRGGKMSVRTSVRPSTKSFFDFNEIWCIGRGR